MKPAGYICTLSLIGYVLTGCAGSAPPDAPVQPVTIGIDTFCAQVRKDRDLTWSVNDTPTTITNIRRLGAKWDARCKAATKPTS